MRKEMLDFLTRDEARKYRSIYAKHDWVRIPFWTKSAAPAKRTHVCFVDTHGDVTSNGAIPSLAAAGYRPCLRGASVSGAVGDTVNLYDCYWIILSAKDGLLLLEDVVGEDREPIKAFGKTACFSKSYAKAWLDAWNEVFFDRKSISCCKAICKDCFAGCSGYCDYDLKLEEFMGGVLPHTFSTDENDCSFFYSREQHFREHHDDDVPYED